MKKFQLSSREIRNLCESLAMLLHAGISPADALHIMAEDEGAAYRELLSKMAAECDSGATLSQAFKLSEALPGYACSLVEVGERTGRIEESLSSLAGFYEDRLRLERQVKTVLLYPAILLAIMLIVIVVLLVEVLPLFDQVYGQMGSTLTGIAGGLLALGQIIKKLMPVICVIIAIACIAALLVVFSEGFKRKLMAGWQKARGGKGIWEQLNVARTAQVLSMARSSGLRMDDALEMAAELMADVPVFKERCECCAKDLAEGVSLSKALEMHKLMPKTESRLLEVGEKGGLGDSALRQIAERLMEESEYALTQKISRIEPCIIVVAAGLVGMILLSVMMPLIQIMASLG